MVILFPLDTIGDPEKNIWTRIKSDLHGKMLQGKVEAEVTVK